MKVKIYIDWHKEEILLEKDVDKVLKEYENEKREDQYVASNILENEGFSYAEVFYMNDELREEMNKRIEEEIKRIAKIDFDENFEEITLDI